MLHIMSVGVALDLVGLVAEPDILRVSMRAAMSTL